MSGHTPWRDIVHKNKKKHRGQHDDDCFACKIQSIQVSSAATPTRKSVRKQNGGS